METEKKNQGEGPEQELAAASTEVPNGSLAVDENSSKNSELNDQESLFTLKFITWNIDGLQIEHLKARTEAVCKIIDQEEADIVFLQEVVPATADYIRERMSNYHCYFADIDKEDESSEESENDKGGEESENDKGGKENEKDEKEEEDEEGEEDEEDEDDERNGYFVGTLLKKSSVSFVNDEVIDFPFSEMSRNLLKINVTYKELQLCLLNSHLESLLESSEERKNQLRILFRTMLDAPENETVVFGGDTNLREKELTEVGGLPSGVEDAWVSCGSQKRCAYTFDMTQNDNLKVNWKFRPRCRYDRVYVRRSSPSKLKPVSFDLIGRKRLALHKCFPSDHWGILCHFEKDDFRFKLDKSFPHSSDEEQILQPYWMRKTCN